MIYAAMHDPESEGKCLWVEMASGGGVWCIFTGDSTTMSDETWCVGLSLTWMILGKEVEWTVNNTLFYDVVKSVDEGHKKWDSEASC